MSDKPQPTPAPAKSPRSRPKRGLARIEQECRELSEEVRAVLDRVDPLAEEATAADYARLGALWARLAEALLKIEQHRAREAALKARLAAARNDKDAGGLSPEAMSGIESQLHLL